MSDDRDYRIVFGRGVYSVFRARFGALAAIVDTDEHHQLHVRVVYGGLTTEEAERLVRDARRAGLVP